MKIVVKALEDTDMSHGEVRLEAKAGENLTLSTGQAEIALSTRKFEFVKEVTESEAETNFVQNQQSKLDAKRADLKENNSHDQLYEMAKDLPGVKKSMSKDQLIDEILKPRAPVGTDAQSTSSDEGERKTGDE